MAFQTINFSEFFDGLTFNIIPDYRRNRAYLSGILAKNEVNREDKYNKKLFVRLKTGMYLPNPLLALLIDEEWVNIYDMIDIDGIEKDNTRNETGFIGQIKSYRKELTDNPEIKIDPYEYWKSI